MKKPALTDLSLEELDAVMTAWGEQKFRSKQVFRWIYLRKATDFDGMSDLPQGLRQRMKKEFVFVPLQVKETLRSADGTEKFLLECADHSIIESVAIPEKSRLTVCVSSQAGCRYACRFCASGSRGFSRNLSCGEIVGQLLVLKERIGQELSHVVFMGTGEPLDNYDNVLKAIRLINSPDGMNIGARRITVSTCGLVDGIRRLATEGKQIELSVSLHASDDATRTRLMPVNRKYPLAKLIAACREYARGTGRQVTFEYVLIGGVNAGDSQADALSALLKGMDAKVNLIPLNPFAEGLQAPSREEAARFRKRLQRNGTMVTQRRARGQDIDAACGQLRLRYEKS